MTQTAPLLLILGALGETGRRATDDALARGFRVRAGDLKLPAPGKAREGVEYMVVDALKGEGLAEALAGVSAVVNTVGLPITKPETALNPPPLHTDGTIHILHAMRGAGVDRLVTLSATFVEERRRGPLWFQAAAATALRRVFDQMGEMETILQGASDIRWTAVRPGWLLANKPFTGDYTVTDDVIPQDMIRTRTSDLAHFMIDCVARNAHVHATPAIARKEDPSESSPIAVLEEVVS